MGVLRKEGLTSAGESGGAGQYLRVREKVLLLFTGTLIAGAVLVDNWQGLTSQQLPPLRPELTGQREFVMGYPGVEQLQIMTAEGIQGLRLGDIIQLPSDDTEGKKRFVRVYGVTVTQEMREEGTYLIPVGIEARRLLCDENGTVQENIGLEVFNLSSDVKIIANAPKLEDLFKDRDLLQ